jgi:Tfp pilus assembly protein PilE
MKILSKTTQRGFTSAEMVVSAMVMAILGIVFLNVLNSGMILYAKNTAVNSAHEEGRQGMNRFVRDLHAAVSVPQLRNNNHDSTYTCGTYECGSTSNTNSFTVVSSTPVGGVAPTAAGISFQNVVTGSPDYVWQDPGNNNMIKIKDPGDQPTPGMRLVVPQWGIEDAISSVVGNSDNHSNIFLANGQDTTVATNMGNQGRKFGQGSYSVGPYAISYYTERMLYVVEGGTYIADSQGPWILSSGNYVAYTSGAMQRYRFENGVLNLYRQRYASSKFYWSKVATVARYISSAQPFYIPLTSGTQDTRYVGVKLSTRDPKTSNRNYSATAALLDTQIDYRSRICLYQ